MAEILLKGGGAAVVDDDMFVELSARRWHLTNGYAKSNDGKWMHRLVAGAGPGDVVDHIDSNRLHKRRSNLRLGNQSLNGANRPRPRNGRSSRFKGVCFDRFTGNWKASIGVRGRLMHLGRFDDEADAARAYDAAAREHFGEFARPNFPEVAA